MKSKLLIPIFVLFFLAAAVNAFVISGQVTDTSAAPINNALIEVFDASNVLVNSTNTNSTGQYSLEAGGPALRIVNASAAGYDAASTPIFVNSNKTVNFALGPIAAVYLSGYVTDGTSPLNNVDIKVKQGGATFTETNTNTAGFYNVSVLDGDSYDVTASLTGYDSETSPVTVSGNTELNFTLNLTPSGCTENWSCTAWSICSGGTQTRICTDLNSCGTEINKPAESRSCDSSSGGGGGYDGTVYTIDLTSSGTSLRLRRKDTVKFYFKGEMHKVEITSISSTLVELLIQSDTFIASLENNQLGKYDLNKDDIYDLKITVDDISFYRTTLSFYLINEPKQAQQTDNTTTTTPLPTYTPPPPKPRKQIIIEDVVQDQQENETSAKPTMFAAAVNFIKNIPYIGYAAAGIIILAIIIVAIKFFKAEEAVEDITGYNKEQLKRRISRLEKQITRLKRNIN